MIATCPQPRSTPISSNKDRKQCFNCQQTVRIDFNCFYSDLKLMLMYQGHIARNCTNESQPRSVEFLNDVEHGHTQQHTKPIKRHHLQVVCDKCGGLNHFAKDCQASDILCYNCQKHGHIARACPLAAASIATVNAATRPVRACYSCGKPGHIARQCLVARRERDDESEEDEDESEDVTDSEEEEHDDEETDHEVSSD